MKHLTGRCGGFKMTTRKFDAMLLNELTKISIDLDNIKLNLELPLISDEERSFYIFKVELLEDNLKRIQKRLREKPLSQNKKVVFLGR